MLIPIAVFLMFMSAGAIAAYLAKAPMSVAKWILLTGASGLATVGMLVLWKVIG